MNIVDGIASKVGELFVESVIKQIGYLILYKSNISNLGEEFKKLENMKEGILGNVAEAERNGREIAAHVKLWLEKVDELSKELDGLRQDEANNGKCLGGWCPNLKSRHSLSRRAAKKITPVVEKLNGEGEKFNYTNIISKEAIMSFKSRESIRDKIELIPIVEANHLFEKIVMTVVSQSPDYKNMQGDIAGGIGLTKIDRDNVSTRAGQLLNKLMNMKILIILDDVWSDQLDLKAIGLPSHDQNPRCKILLTSRNKDVCHKMGCEKKDVFEVSVLSKNEAWELFKENAGNSVENPGISTTAKEIADECGGLPLAIVTVSKALGDKEQYEWVNALGQLKNSSVSSFREMQECVYSRIQISYNLLGNDEEAKSCLLLCCLFPEDYNIPIEYPLRYGAGLELFKDVPTLLLARYRVHSLVDKLKRCFLLLDSDRKESIKMPDVVRNVILSIARVKHGYTVCCDKEGKEWQKEDTWDRSNAISIFMEENEKIPNELECPKLELLQLALPKISIQDSFFLGMTQLKVASFLKLQNSSMPSSVQKSLHNLHTLCLDNCPLKDISVIGSTTLKNLGILSVVNSDIEELPKEIVVLSNLKLLDLTGCDKLKRIPCGVLASLSRLEELYVSCKSFRWGEHSVSENNASLNELKSLAPCLRVLEIFIEKAELLPRDLNFEKLEKFWVYIGENASPFLYREGYLAPNSMKLKELNDSDQYKYNYEENLTINQLIEKSEILKLEKLVLKFICKERGLPRLKRLSIKSCDQLEYLVDASDWKGPPCTPLPQLMKLKLLHLHDLKDICWHGHVPDHKLCKCFVNLRIVVIRDCDTLRSLFTLMQATSLAQLESVDIWGCDKIEFIVSVKLSELLKEASPKIGFLNIAILHLRYLPRLIGFIEDANHVRMSDTHEHSPAQMGETTEVLDVLFTSTYFHRFPRLASLVLEECHSVEVLFDFGGAQVVDAQAADQKILFPLLKEIEVGCMNKLKHVWRASTNVSHKIQGFHNLTSLSIWRCDSLRFVLTPSIVKLLTQLETLEIKRCEVMETVVEEDGLVQLNDGHGKNKEAVGIVLLPKLSYFELSDLPILESICPDPYHFRLPELKFFKVLNCPKLKTSSSEIQSIAKKVDVPSYSTTHEHSPAQMGETTEVLDVLFTSTYFHWFPRLASLVLEECHSVEVLFDFGGAQVVDAQAADQKILFPLLKEIEVKGMNKLKHDTSAEVHCHEKEMPKLSPSHTAYGSTSCQLEELEFDGCDYTYDAMFDLAENSDPALPALNCLKKISLRKLPKLICIWKTGSNGTIPQGSIGFNNLTSFIVTECDMLRNLFPSSVAKLLVNLHEIRVSNCKMLEDIVEIRGGQEESLEIEECDIVEETVCKGEIERSSNKIVLPKLRYLDLQNLPSLRGFCLHQDDPYAFDFPSLEILTIWCCNKMELFSYGSVGVPTKFNGISFKYIHDYTAHFLGDLNATVQRIYNGMVPKIESREFYAFGGRVDFKRMEHDQCLLGRFTKCTRLNVGDCEQLSNVVPSNMIQRFQHLEELRIEQCNSLVEVFESQGVVDDATEHQGDATVLYELQVMYLYRLPKLTHIWKINHFRLVGFPNLRKLHIMSCNSLESVLSPSMARSLVQLQVLLVAFCANMGDIVTKEDEKSLEGVPNKTDAKKIVFPKLRVLVLGSLPNLKCFHPGSTYDFEFPSCEDVNIAECPRIETFSCGTVSTPMLKRVRDSLHRYDSYMAVMGDLNSTIQHAYSLKVKGKRREGNQGEVHMGVGVPKSEVVDLDQDRNITTVPPPLAKDQSMQLLTSETSVASASNHETQIPPSSSHGDAEMQPTSTSSSTPTIPSTTPTLLPVHSPSYSFPIQHLNFSQYNNIYPGRSVKIKDISTEKKEEFAKLWSEAETFGFDLGWLAPYYEQAIEIGELNEAKMKEVKELEVNTMVWLTPSYEKVMKVGELAEAKRKEVKEREEKMLSLQERVNNLKQMLEEAEKELTEKDLELAEAKKDLKNRDYD
ncbi:Disease resistance protein [Quillaja saponaria]|uniref:Disease resistance protein n=1 Tax=Quillaja saponaria TaxID=32244 RepID=A0AAD7Q3P5_QUISA|nr:Disease resistance protein [Quillaja saponaria]